MARAPRDESASGTFLAIGTPNSSAAVVPRAGREPHVGDGTTPASGTVGPKGLILDCGASPCVLENQAPVASEEIRVYYSDVESAMVHYIPARRDLRGSTTPSPDACINIKPAEPGLWDDRTVY